MNTNKIREWNDETAWAAIANLAENPNARILIVAKHLRTLLGTFEKQLDSHYNIMTMRYNQRALHFRNGAIVQLTLLQRVVEMNLRGCEFAGAFFIDSRTWSAYEQEVAVIEIAPLLGRTGE